MQLSNATNFHFVRFSNIKLIIASQIEAMTPLAPLTPGGVCEGKKCCCCCCCGDDCDALPLEEEETDPEADNTPEGSGDLRNSSFCLMDSRSRIIRSLLSPPLAFTAYSA